jgi:hypothetical protein
VSENDISAKSVGQKQPIEEAIAIAAIPTNLEIIQTPQSQKSVFGLTIRPMPGSANSPGEPLKLRESHKSVLFVAIQSISKSAIYELFKIFLKKRQCEL